MSLSLHFYFFEGFPNPYCDGFIHWERLWTGLMEAWLTKADTDASIRRPSGGAGGVGSLQRVEQITDPSVHQTINRH